MRFAGLSFMGMLCLVLFMSCSDQATGGNGGGDAGEPPGDVGVDVGLDVSADGGDSSVELPDAEEPPPQLEFDPPVVSFGAQTVGGAIASSTVIVRNLEKTNLTIESIEKVVNDPGFLFNLTSMELWGKGEEELDILFDPKTEGEHVEALRFVDASGVIQGELPIQAMVVPPECQDVDGDGYGVDCAPGPDCDETDTTVHAFASEPCDQQDNDCDGKIDEDFVDLGDVCFGGLGECITQGKYVCSEDGTSVYCSAELTSGITELCNGIDDDCDGATDEIFPKLGEPCVIGVGACAKLDKYVCSGDGTNLVCNVQPGVPQLEQCYNLMDDDCDGVTDEGELEICDDGIDNDCDGEIDESGSDWGEVFFARSSPDSGVEVHRSNGDGTFQPMQFIPFAPGYLWRLTSVGDFDGDFYLDLMLSRRSIEGYSPCEDDFDCGVGSLCAGALCHTKCTLGQTCPLEGEVCVDHNWNNWTTDTYCVRETTVVIAQSGCAGDTSLLELFTIPSTVSATHGRAVDADGNGHLDYVALGNHANHKGVTWLNDGEGNFTFVDDAFDFSNMLTYKYTLNDSARDFTGDGRPDLIGATFTSGGNPPTTLWLIEGKGDGTFHDPLPLSVQYPYPANLITGNDFDGDGDPDLVGGLDDDGQPGGVWMILNAEAGWQAPYPIFDVAPNYNSGGEHPGHGNGASFDFTGDGLPDIISAYAPEECGSYVWGCTGVTDPSNVCYGGDCRKLSFIENRTGQSCAVGQSCVAGQCVGGCVPDCEDKACGDNGCFGTCGACEPGQVCSLGACVVDCIPDCTGKLCGDNGCGGVCGNCASGESCIEGGCVGGCVPNCSGKKCGDDGCGGICAVFEAPEVIQFTANPHVHLRVPVNVPPTQPEVAVIPEDPAAGETLECVVVQPSIDLDPVTYARQWWRDGVYVKELGDVPMVPPGVTVSGEDWRCEVQATDGLEWSVAAEALVTIGGTP